MVMYALTGASVNIDIQPVNDKPVITLDADNSGGGTDDNGYNIDYDEGDGAVAILDTADAGISDIDDTQLTTLTVTVAGLQDGDEEEITIGGETFPLGTDDSFTVTVGGTSFDLSYTSGVFTITEDAGGEISITDINTLLATNDGDDNSDAVVSTISIITTNDAPVAVDDTDTELVEDGSTTISLITGNDTDVDGTVDASTIVLIDPSNASNIYR